MMETLLDYFGIESRLDLIWLCVGMVAQLMFSMRFIIQWLSTERQRKSTIPNAFWWFSLMGGLMLLTYGFHRGEPVIILGQGIGIVIYLRNLWFIYVVK